MQNIEEQVERIVHDETLSIAVCTEDLARVVPAASLVVEEAWARAAHAATLASPTPRPLRIRKSRRDQLRLRRQATLRRLAAELAAARGRPDELFELMRSDWRASGATPLRLVERLIEFERNDEAAALIRGLLAAADCTDRDYLKSRLDALGAPPDGWDGAVRAFAAHPSEEAWDELMQFTPTDVYYQRLRHTIHALIRLDVDPDIIFRCTTRHGTTSDAIELVERGLVSPETVLARAENAPPTARGLWLALAAQAAQARGDRFRTVRLLQDAYRAADPDFPPDLHADAIRDAADPALNALLDAAGIPG